MPSCDEEAGNSSSDDDFDGLATVTADGGASAAATESSARWRQVTAANDQAPSSGHSRIEPKMLTLIFF